MGNRNRDALKNWNRIVETSSESILDETDAEIQSDLKELGTNLAAEARLVDELFSRTLKKVRQKKLYESIDTHKLRSEEYKSKKISIPSSTSERRALLNAIISKQPNLAKGLITTQFRDFESLPDEDVESLLRQLLSLGYSDDSGDAGN